MAAKIAAALALLLALSGWALYKQIQASGELKAQIEQRDAWLLESARKVGALSAEITARDNAITELEAKRDEHDDKTERVGEVVHNVYIQPDVQPWADTVPPAAVVDAIGSGIACLWESAGGGGNADCSAIAARRDNGGLPAP